MQNNILDIAERIVFLIKSQERVPDDTEFHVLHQVSDEILSNMG